MLRLTERFSQSDCCGSMRWPRLLAPAARGLLTGAVITSALCFACDDPLVDNRLVAYPVSVALILLSTESQLALILAQPKWVFPLTTNLRPRYLFLTLFQ